jgi:hypothetical protein
MQPIREAAPQRLARVAAIWYLLEFLTGGVAISVVGKMITPGDAAATATKILANQALFQLGVAANVAQFVCYIAVTGLLYFLFKPVNARLSLLAAFFSLVGCTVGAVSCLFELAPLTVLGGATYLKMFTAGQLQAMALVFLNLYHQLFNMSFVFFGCYCLLIGYLILRSTFLPRFLGVGMLMAGLGWLTYLWPPLTLLLSPYIVAVGLGEVALVIWLLVAGVNAERWSEQARRHGASTSGSIPSSV